MSPPGINDRLRPVLCEKPRCAHPQLPDDCAECAGLPAHGCDGCAVPGRCALQTRLFEKHVPADHSLGAPSRPLLSVSV